MGEFLFPLIKEDAIRLLTMGEFYLLEKKLFSLLHLSLDIEVVFFLKDPILLLSIL